MSASSFFGRLKRLRILPPRNSDFFDQLEKLADSVAEASHWLTELFTGDPKRGQEIASRIETCLTRSLQIERSVENLLARAQQPPFARSEIGQFATECIHIVKFVNHASNRYVIYEIPSSDKEMRELGQIIKEACELIVDAVKALRHDHNLEPFSRAVDQLESRADEIYHGGLRRRFQEIRRDRSTIESNIKGIEGSANLQEVISLISQNVEYTRHVAVFFILRQVYAELERAIDSCTEATDTLKRMVADNV